MILCDYVIRICLEKQNFMYKFTKLGQGVRTAMMNAISEFSYSFCLSNKLSLQAFHINGFACYLQTFLIIDCIFLRKN